LKEWIRFRKALRQPEINDADAYVLIEQDILSFQVAVDNFFCVWR
jgi:hypothetical protein